MKYLTDTDIRVIADILCHVEKKFKDNGMYMPSALQIAFTHFSEEFPNVNRIDLE